MTRDTDTNGGRPPELAFHHPPFEEATQDNPNPFIEPQSKRLKSQTRHHPTDLTGSSTKPPPKGTKRKHKRTPGLAGPSTEQPVGPSPAPPPINKTEFGRKTTPAQSFADSVRSPKGRHPPTKHRDTPSDATQLRMHNHCKQPAPVLETLREPTPFERTILDEILNGNLALDQAPKFLKQILPADEMALFGDQMRVHYGYLHVPIKAAMKLTNDMPSTFLGRLFFPANPKNNGPAVQECEALRKDMHSCHIHPSGRSLVLQFNSKSKAKQWLGRPTHFMAQPTVLLHYRRHEDPVTALDTEEAQQGMAYCFRLLYVPTYIKTIQVWKLLASLDVVVRSLEQAQNVGSGELDANSYLIMTASPIIPPRLAHKSRISIGEINVGLFHYQDHGNMPCRKCASLDHPAERCTGKAIHPDRIITLDAGLWATTPVTSIPQRPGFAAWRQQLSAFIPARPKATQTEHMTRTHEAGTQVTMRVEYGTSPEPRLADGWAQTEDSTQPVSPSTPTSSSRTAPVEPEPRPSVMPWVDEPESEPTPAPTPERRGYSSPRPMDPPRQERHAKAERPPVHDDIPHATASAEFFSQYDWDMTDQLKSPRTEQPTPTSMDPPVTLEPQERDASPAANMDGVLEAGPSNSAAHRAAHRAAHLKASAPTIGRPQSGPKPTDPVPNPSHQSVKEVLTSCASTQPRPLDLTQAEQYHGAAVTYHRQGSLHTVLEQRAWKAGTVPAKGQCCFQALYCVMHRHHWTAGSNHSAEVAQGLVRLKRSIRDMVMSHPALQDQYHTRWTASLSNPRVPTQASLQEYIADYFDRVEDAPPNKTIASLDWGGFPEIAAASALSGQPVYVIQAQLRADTWWLWRVSYAPGQEDILKEAIHSSAWAEVLSTFTEATPVLVHRNGDHFDPLHLQGPHKSAREDKEPDATPLPPIPAQPPQLAAIFLPAKPLPPPLTSRRPMAVKGKEGLPILYAKQATIWIKDKAAELDGVSYALPIRTVDQLEPFLLDFPCLAREMLWALGSPEVVLSKCRPLVTLEWGQHMLLASCYHSIALAKREVDTPKEKQDLESWRRRIIDAPTMDAALCEALDVHTWQDTMKPKAGYSGIYTPAFHTDLEACLLPWMAVIFSLLDTEGLEEEDMPSVPTLTDFHTLATTDDLSAVAEQLSQGTWHQLWPWIQTNAYSWGCSSTGYRE